MDKRGINKRRDVRLSDIMEVRLVTFGPDCGKQKTKTTASADLLTQLKALMSSQFSCFPLLTESSSAIMRPFEAKRESHERPHSTVGETPACAASCPDKYSKTPVFLLILDVIKSRGSQV